MWILLNSGQVKLTIIINSIGTKCLICWPELLLGWSAISSSVSARYCVVSRKEFLYELYNIQYYKTEENLNNIS